MTLTVISFCPKCTSMDTKCCSVEMEASDVDDYLNDGNWMMLANDLDIVTKDATLVLCYQLEQKAVVVECGKTYDLWLPNPIVGKLKDALEQMATEV
ncbi:MAG: hypothetical protein ACTSWQ_05005 [Candidatus Thorarchaeota archaeon]